MLTNNPEQLQRQPDFFAAWRLLSEWAQRVISDNSLLGNINYSRRRLSKLEFKGSISYTYLEISRSSLAIYS